MAFPDTDSEVHFPDGQSYSNNVPAPVPLIPMALRGLRCSFFSHEKRKAIFKLPLRFWSRIGIHTGRPVPPEEVSADLLRSMVLELRREFR